MTEEQRNEIIKKMKDEHGRVIHMYSPATDDGDPEVFVVAKSPSRSEWKRFRAMLFDDAQKPEASETLARACIVYPSREEFAALLELLPALAEGIGGKLADAAGSGRELETKKH